MKAKLFLLLFFIPGVLLANEPYPHAKDPTCIFYTKLDETSGAPRDYSLNNMTLKVGGTIRYSYRGVANKGISINNSLGSSGSDGVVYGNATLVGQTDNITVMAWVYALVPEGGGGQVGGRYGNIVTKGANLGSGDWMFCTSAGVGSPNDYQFRLRSSTATTTYDKIASATSKCDYGRWHHVVGRYNGTHAVIFVDGVMQTPLACAGPRKTGTEPLTIGGINLTSYPGTGYAWAGTLDEVAVYNRSMEQPEIALIYNWGIPVHGDTGHAGEVYPWKNDANLTAYWDFNELTGVYDNKITTLSNGTVVGTVTRGVRGNFDKAFAVTGTGYVDCTNNSAIYESNNQWSVSVWFNRYKIATGGIFCQGDSRPIRFEYTGTRTNKIGVTIRNATLNAFTLVENTTSDQIGKWYNYITTYDNATLKLYQNGVLVNSTTMTNGLAPATGNLTIGASPFQGNFSGVIDEVRNWNKALNQTEIDMINYYGR